MGFGRDARAFWSGVDAAAAPTAALFMTGGLIRTLGRDDYGVLVVVLALSALSMAISPAIAATTTKYVSESIGSGGSDERIARIMAASLAAVAAAGAFFLTLFWIFSRQLTHIFFSNAVAIRRPELGSILLLAILAVAVQQTDAVFAAALRGLERFMEQALVEISARVSTVCMTVATGWVTHRLLYVLTTYCAMLALFAVCRGMVFRRLAPTPRLFARPHLGELKGVLNFGGWMWLSASASVAYGSLDRVMVARLLGPAAAARFQVYMQLSQLVHYVPSSLLAFAFPVFSRLSASVHEQGRHTISTMYRKLFVACVIGGIVIASLLLVFRTTLIGAIAGKVLAAENDTAFVLLVCGFALLSVAILPYYLLLGLGRSRSVSLITSASMILAVASMPVLISKYGIEGAAIARLGYPCGALLLLYSVRTALTKA